MTEEAVSAAAEAVAAAEVSAADQEKCTKQHAQTANRKQRYPSYHPVTDLYIAGNVTQSTNQRDIEQFYYNS